MNNVIDELNSIIYDIEYDHVNGKDVVKSIESIVSKLENIRDINKLI
tara:strand:- start:384 stop:524 length:141 start_codon:yes stop_codon:yes gene_type:complete